MHCANFPTSVIKIIIIMSVFLHRDVYKNFAGFILQHSFSRLFQRTAKHTQTNKRAFLLAKGSTSLNTAFEQYRPAEVVTLTSVRDTMSETEDISTWTKEGDGREFGSKNKSNFVTITMRISCKQKTKCYRRQRQGDDAENSREVKAADHLNYVRCPITLYWHADTR